ncbi:hypothetical protein F5Y17DRAFT_430432 [Xylariaceae sp. FL0594]|nr:hypothetical protein F5Y17DRAFT_430432 [Xylariaceae sp. FL0594]
MALLTELPTEIVCHILGFVDAEDLLFVPRVCRALYHTIVDNSSLFRTHYLKLLDAPPKDSHVDWQKTVRDVLRLQAIDRKPDVASKRDELRFVYGVVTELLQSAATTGARCGLPAGMSAQLPDSRNAGLLAAFFSSQINRSAFLTRSFIFERARADAASGTVEYWQGPPKREHQLSAHLHCLYGVPQLFADPPSTAGNKNGEDDEGGDSTVPPDPVHRWQYDGKKKALVRPFAISKVYDNRQYSRATKWGPFMADGTMRVDWEKVEAVMVALNANIESMRLSQIPLLYLFSNVPFAGTWPKSWQPPPPPGPGPAPLFNLAERRGPRVPDPLEHLDPYGVTGVWLRIVCYLDYNDFYAHNYSVPPHTEGALSYQQPPPHISRAALDDTEATRLILMRIYVTKVEAPGPGDGQGLPVVHFKGIARHLMNGINDHPVTDLRGTVRLTPAGDVHWTTFTIIDSEDVWRSESIQVGGVGSAKGVIGHWFDATYDPVGPVGPTAFWKISDRNKALAAAGDDDDDDDDDDYLDDGGDDDDEDEMALPNIIVNVNDHPEGEDTEEEEEGVDDATYTLHVPGS